MPLYGRADRRLRRATEAMEAESSVTKLLPTNWQTWYILKVVGRKGRTAGKPQGGNQSPN